MKRRLVNFLSIAALAIVVAGCSENDPSGLVGTPAPDFLVSGIGKGDVKLADYKGKVVILDFWATYCGPCKMLMPIIMNLQEKYGKNDLVVLGVSAESAEKVTAFKAANQQLNYDLFVDKMGVASSAYKADALPTTVIIGRDGKIVYWDQGVSDAIVQKLAKAVDDAVKQS